MVRPWYFNSMASLLLRLRRCAVFGLSIATLSQVSFVSGFGNSCSQPLFEKRPSQIVGSGRKTISSPCGATPGESEPIPDFKVTCLGGNAVPAITQSRSVFSHNALNPAVPGAEAPACCACQN